jgi:uncharacterized membrane protein YfcA
VFDPDSFSLLLWVLAAAITVLSGLLHGSLGLGFSMMATPLVAILTDVRSAILFTLLPTIVVNVVSILKGGNWRESLGRHWPLALMIPLGSLLGTYVLININPSPFRLLLAAIVLLYLYKDRLHAGQLTWVRSHRWLAYLLFGLGAGFLAGTVNVMVPLLIILALELGLTPVALVQVFNFCFLTGKVAQVGAFAAANVLTPALLFATLPFAAIAAGSLYVGMRIRNCVDAQTYEGWLRKLLVVLVVVLIAQFFLDLRETGNV